MFARAWGSIQKQVDLKSIKKSVGPAVAHCIVKKEINQSDSQKNHFKSLNISVTAHNALSLCAARVSSLLHFLGNVMYAFREKQIVQTTLLLPKTDMAP